MVAVHVLQSEAGYIDARPHPPDQRIPLRRTAGPYIWVISGPLAQLQLWSASPLTADQSGPEALGRCVPRTDSCTAANSIAIQSVRRRGRRAAWEVSADRRAKSWHCGGTHPRLRQRRV